MAHRIQALRNLPFIVVSNPNISKIYNYYLHSFSTLLPFREKKIASLEDEIRFTEVLADLVQTHSNTIPILARGFAECRKYINPTEITYFLDEHLRARIGTRLIAEQHIALHFSTKPQKDSCQRDNSTSPHNHNQTSYIGVIDTALQPASIINSCGAFVSDICELKYGVRPSWVIDGDPSITFAYVPVHLEYIITELLKNAFRATVESDRSQEPVVITIAAEPGSSPRIEPEKPEPDIKHREHNDTSITPLFDSTSDVTIRIRDRGGGISPEVLPKIWSYSFTTFADEEFPGSAPLPAGNSNSGMDALNAISGVGLGSAGIGSSIAGLGYGLPLGRAYAEYFGGGIAVQSLYGWGCVSCLPFGTSHHFADVAPGFQDVYLRLKGISKIQS